MQRSKPVILYSRLLFFVIALCAPIYGIMINIIKQISPETYFIAAITAIVALAITHIPDIMCRKNIVLPTKLQEFMVIFVVLSMFCGEILNFYERFVWWDTMLHFFSGIMLSFIGFRLFLSLSKISSKSEEYNPVVAIVFAIMFAIACGAIWEIIEFAGDSLLGMNMQRWQILSSDTNVLQSSSNLSNPGLINTMKDIICGVVGSLCSVIFMLPLEKASVVNAISSKLLN